MGLAAATLCLMVLGALVRANGAGLACPDWPLCFGEVVPRFDVRVGFEWSHRALAGGISLGLAALSVLAWRARAPVGRLLVAAWALLGVQVLLGALTVWLLLAPWTVTAHLVVGTAFCATLMGIGLALLDPPARRVAPLGRGVAAFVAVLSIAVAGQIVLGGLVSSNGAGLACADFPTCDGRSFVPTLSGLVGLQVLHRINAFLVLGLFVTLASLTREAGRLGSLARMGLQLVLLQMVVGVANVLWRLPVELTGLHSALAAGTALLTVVLVREVLRARASEPARGKADERASESAEPEGVLEAG